MPLLYLQFAKDELSLPASRENIADTDKNATAIATRLATTIVEIARQVPIRFKDYLDQNDLSDSYDVLAVFPILSTSGGICSNKGLRQSEEYAIAMWRKEIESGCLKAWREKQ